MDPSSSSSPSGHPDGRAPSHDGAPIAPIYATGCLTDQRFGDGTCEELLRVQRWMLEVDGRLAVGALALLADSATGFAVSNHLPSHMTLVTAQLRLEMFRAAASGSRSLRGVGEMMHADADVGFARALLSEPDGSAIAMASMRSAHVLHPEGRRPQVRVEEGPSGVVPLPDESVDALLGSRVLEQDEIRTVVGLVARPELTNAAANVHGGVIAMMIERAIVSSLAAIVGCSPFRPLDLEITYLRPLPGDGSDVTAVARVASRTRRFVQVVGDVTRADGRVAATVRATYAHAGASDSPHDSEPGRK